RVRAHAHARSVAAVGLGAEVAVAARRGVRQRRIGAGERVVASRAAGPGRSEALAGRAVADPGRTRLAHTRLARITHGAAGRVRVAGRPVGGVRVGADTGVRRTDAVHLAGIPRAAGRRAGDAGGRSSGAVGHGEVSGRNGADPTLAGL